MYILYLRCLRLVSVVTHGEVAAHRPTLPVLLRLDFTLFSLTRTNIILKSLCQSWYARNTDAALTFNMSGNGFYDLGGLEMELRLAGTNVNLRLSSELKFVTTRKDEDDGSEPRLPEHLLDNNDHHKPWVTKSHGYQLVVSLNIDAVLGLEDEAFAQQVAAQLKQSKARSGEQSQFEYANMSLLDLESSWTHGDFD
jgi:hypothetical protein